MPGIIITGNVNNITNITIQYTEYCMCKNCYFINEIVKYRVSHRISKISKLILKYLQLYFVNKNYTKMLEIY